MEWTTTQPVVIQEIIDVSTCTTQDMSLMMTVQGEIYVPEESFIVAKKVFTLGEKTQFYIFVEKCDVDGKEFYDTWTCFSISTKHKYDTIVSMLTDIAQ